MREILFRGKRLDNGEWVCSGNIIRFNPEEGKELVFIPAMHERCVCVHDGNDNITAFETGMFYKVDPDTVGQYTGLKDKNGKKIFEGDILTHNGKWPGYVKYGEWNCSCCNGVYGWALENGDDLRDPEQFLQVAGNIHDNPELLKGE